MAKAAPKTTPTEVNVADYITAIADPVKQADSMQLVNLFEDLTGHPAKMWGPSIIGFGSYHYRYASGHEGDAPLLGFSPRAAAITVYLAAGVEDREPLFAQLGKHKLGKGCLYIKRLSDVNLETLEEILVNNIKFLTEAYPVL